MKQVIIFGTSLMAKRLYDCLIAEGLFKVSAFVVEKDFIEADEFCGLPVAEYESIGKEYPPHQFDIFICIGYTKMNSVRERIFNDSIKSGYEILNYISPDAIVHAKKIGHGNLILGASILSAGVELGNGNIFIENAVLSHDTIVGDFNFFATSSSIAGLVTIGNNCFFGNNCTVRDSITIADYTLAGAASCLSSDTDRFGVYIPAKTVKIEKTSMDVNI